MFRELWAGNKAVLKDNGVIFSRDCSLFENQFASGLVNYRGEFSGAQISCSRQDLSPLNNWKGKSLPEAERRHFHRLEP